MCSTPYYQTLILGSSQQVIVSCLAPFDDSLANISLIRKKLGRENALADGDEGNKSFKTLRPGNGSNQRRRLSVQVIKHFIYDRTLGRYGRGFEVNTPPANKTWLHNLTEKFLYRPNLPSRLMF